MDYPQYSDDIPDELVEAANEIIQLSDKYDVNYLLAIGVAIDGNRYSNIVGLRLLTENDYRELLLRIFEKVNSVREIPFEPSSFFKEIARAAKLNETKKNERGE